MSFHLRGHRSKTRAQYRISQRQKYTATKPELDVRKIVFDLGHDYVPYPAISVKDGINWWTFNPDIQLVGTRTLIEVDGKYHDTPTQERKTEWRDNLLIKADYRIIHIDSELTETQNLRLYLTTKLREAIASSEMIVRIDA